MKRAALIAFALLLFPAGAPAATVAVETGIVRYTALPEEVNLVDVTHDPDYDTAEGPTIWILEYSADLTPGTGCAYAPNIWGQRLGVACAGATSVELDLGDKDDAMFGFVTAPTTVRAGAGDDLVWTAWSDDTIDGGPGDDRILGDRGRDTIFGGDGADTLDGDNGEPGGPTPQWAPLEGDRVVGDPDVVDGGAGDDIVLGDGGADVIRGGPGTDFVDYKGRRRAVTVTLAGGADDGEPGEADDLSDVERVRTTRYADAVSGSAADELLQLGGGDDRADGGSGRDRIEAGAGDDWVDMRDTAVDTLLCGPGADRAWVDGEDEITSDCDALDRPVGPPRYAGTLRVSAGRSAGGLVRVRGALLLAPEHRAACQGASVSIRVIAGRTSTRAEAPLDGACRFSSKLRLAAPRRTRVRVSVELPATARLVAARAGARVRGR